jgi:hypothetical protein
MLGPPDRPIPGVVYPNEEPIRGSDSKVATGLLNPQLVAEMSAADRFTICDNAYENVLQSLPDQSSYPKQLDVLNQ